MSFENLKPKLGHFYAPFKQRISMSEVPEHATYLNTLPVIFSPDFAPPFCATRKVYLAITYFIKISCKIQSQLITWKSIKLIGGGGVVKES